MRMGFIVCLVGLLALGGPAQAEDFDAIEELLKSGRHDQRLKGLDQLVAAGKSGRAEELALRAAADKDWIVQIKAIETLAVVGSDDARKTLLKLSYEGEIQRVRDAAIKTLGGLDRPRTVARLAKLAVKAKGMTKVRMLEAAGQLAGPDDLKKLRRFVKDKNVFGAAAGVRALGRLAVHEEIREEVLKSVRGALELRDDTSDFLAYVAAVEACGALATPEARDLLIGEILLQEDDDLYIQERIARALTSMEGVVEALQVALPRARDKEQARRLTRLMGRLQMAGLRADLETLLSHRYERVRSEAARGLARLAAPESEAPLLGAFESEQTPLVRVELVTALARVLEPEAYRGLHERMQADSSDLARLQYVVELDGMGKPEAIETLTVFVADKNWEVACAATASIGTLGIAKDMDVVTPLLKHKDWRRRASAFEALGRLRAAEAVPLLIEGLRDKDPVVRGVCHGNLQILCERSYEPKPKPWLVWWKREGHKRRIVKRSRRTKEEIEAEEKKKATDDRYAKPDPSREYAEKRKREIEIMQKARILVVTGAWDHVEIVLKHLKIKHQAMRAQELKDVGLNPNQIVLVNCEGSMDKRTRERVRWFVVVGGYLMSTDWALTKAVGQTFPGYLDQSAKSNTGNDVVVVEEAAPGHPLTEGVFEGVAALKWWLEIQAFPIQVLYPERTEVLVDSRYMRQRYGTSPMAAVFRYGLGKVQHSVSHFYLQEEAMSDLREKRARMIFAVDHLGLSLERVRRMAGYGQFDGAITEKTMEEIAPDYSMFRMIVNMVREKADWVEAL